MSRHHPGEPPRLAERLLRRVLPAGVVGDSIIGDVREEYAEYVRRNGIAPRAWYCGQAAKLAAGYVITRGRDVEMGSLWSDLRFGARALGRMPGSAVISVLVLAIGIGLCSFMFSLVYGVYFRGLDIPEADRVLVAYQTDIANDQLQARVPIQDLADWRERQTSFEGLLGYYGGTVNLSATDGPMRFDGAFVSANTFSVLRVQPILGRGFVEGDDAPGAPMNVVLGYGAWIDRFGGDPGVVGLDVRVNGERGSVLGVMPEGFEFPDNAEVWVPFRDDPLATERRAGRFATVYGRLADGVTRERAEMELAGIARQLEQEYPESNEGRGAQLDTPVEANTNPQLDLMFSAMMIAVICVLLVACANVANLLLSRAAMRTKEAGIRVAMGGGRFRVMLPFFSEAFVLAAAGAVIGIGIAFVGVEWFDAVSDPARTGRPSFMRFTVDAPILVFVVGLTMLTALVAGLAPALKMSRTDVNAVLKDEARGSSGLYVGRLSRILVTSEVALSCALLVGAGLMTKSLVNLGNTDYAFETDGLFTARVGLFPADYPDRRARLEMWHDLRDELARAPGVSRVALTTNLPFQGVSTIGVALDGVEYEEPRDLTRVNRVVVTTGFFETMGVELQSGRDFIETDDTSTELVAIVNRPMVDRYFGGEDPIGRSFREGLSDTLPAITVIGVAPDMDMAGSLPPGFPGYEPSGYYLPLRQHDASFMSIAVLPRGADAMALTGDVRAAVQRLDADLPIYDVYSEAEVIDRSIWFLGVFGSVFIGFGVAALFMASVGLYGVLSFAVTRRTQEVGIRMALGAGSREVVGLVARQGAGQLAVGLAIGFALAFGLMRMLTIVMYEVDPQDPVVFGAVFLIIVAVGMAAAVFPAWRATTVSPVEALRSE